jgi:hypothetical protein
MSCPRSTKWTGYCAKPHCLFFEVIILAIILLLIELIALIVLVVVTRMILASIVLMTIVVLLVITIMSVALMMVALLVTKLLVARVTAAPIGKMSCLLLFWLLPVLGDLLKNASRFIGSLTLIKKGNALKWVCGHHLVCLRKLKLMRLGLRKEDLFALLLCHGQLHCSMEIATVEVAEELYLTPHELMHRHEGGILGSAKPADQLVTNIGEPGDCLKVIPDALAKVCLCMVCFSGALLGNDARPFSWTYILKTLAHHVEQCWTTVLLCIQKSSQNL